MRRLGAILVLLVLGCAHARVDDAGSWVEGLSPAEAKLLARDIVAFLGTELPPGPSGPVELDEPEQRNPLTGELESGLRSAGYAVAQVLTDAKSEGSGHRLRYRVQPGANGLVLRLSLDWKTEATRLYRRGPDGLYSQTPWSVGRWE